MMEIVRPKQDVGGVHGSHPTDPCKDHKSEGGENAQGGAASARDGTSGRKSDLVPALVPTAI
jgi:hypothetical protein